MKVFSQNLIENLTEKESVLVLPDDIVAKIIGMIKMVDLAKLIGDDVLDRYIIVNSRYKSRRIAQMLINNGRRNSLHYLVLRGKIRPDEVVEILLNTRMYYDLVAYFLHRYEGIDKNRFQIFIQKLIGGYPKKRVKYIELLGSGEKQRCVNKATIEMITKRGDADLLRLLYRNGMISHPEKILEILYNYGDRKLFEKILEKHPDKSFLYKYSSDLELWREMWSRGNGDQNIFTMLDGKDYLNLVRKSYREEVILFYLEKMLFASAPLAKILDPELIKNCLDFEGRIIRKKVFDYLLQFRPDLSKTKISPRLILYGRDIKQIELLDELKLDWNQEKIVLNFLWNRPKSGEIVNRTYRMDSESKWLYSFVLEKSIDNDGTDDDWVLYAIGVGDIGMLRKKLGKMTRWGDYFMKYRFDVSLQVQLAYHLGRYEMIDLFKKFGWVEDTYRHDIGYLL